LCLQDAIHRSTLDALAWAYADDEAEEDNIVLAQDPSEIHDKCNYCEEDLPESMIGHMEGTKAYFFCKEECKQLFLEERQELEECFNQEWEREVPAAVEDDSNDMFWQKSPPNVPTDQETNAFFTNGSHQFEGVVISHWKTATEGGLYSFSKAKRCKSETRIGPQAAAFQFAEFARLPFTFQYVVCQKRSPTTVNQRYSYVSFRRVKDIAFFLTQSTQKRIHQVCPLYEVIQANRPARLHFDVDAVLECKEKEAREIHNRFGDLLVQATEEVLQEEFEVDSVRGTKVLLWENFREISRCHFKSSFHGICCFVIAHTNTSDLMKFFGETIQDYVLQNESVTSDFWENFKNTEFVDKRIYTRNRLFRTPFASKHSTNYVDFVNGICSPFTLHSACTTFAANKSAEELLALSLVSIPPSWLTGNHPFTFVCTNEDTKVVSNTTTVAKENIMEDAVSEFVSDQEIPLPIHEAAMVKKWIQRFYEERKRKFDLPDVPLQYGSVTVKNHGVIFLSCPNDRYCEMKDRSHEGDLHGRQTTYALDLLTSKISQNCFSCGKGLAVKMASCKYDLYNAFSSKNQLQIAQMMREELQASGRVRVTEDAVFIFDACGPWSGEYNNVCTNSSLWIEGTADYLKAAFVMPFISRKIDFLLKCMKTDEEKLARIQKIQSGVSTNAFLTSITSLLSTLLCERTQMGQRGFKEELNMMPYLLPTNDGCVVDLCSGEKIDRKAEHLFSMECPAKVLDSGLHAARVQRVKDFVLSVMSGNAEKAVYLQKIMGYSASADHTNRKYFWHIGFGRNGKTSLDEIISGALGDFHKTVRSEFVSKVRNEASSNQASPDVVALQYARMISVSETAQDQQLKACLVKKIASGDRCSGRALYKGEKNFVLPGKLHIFTNFLSSRDSQDQALLDRESIVTYQSRFVTENPREEYNELLANSELVKELKEDRDAVLTWLVEGSILAFKDIEENGCIRIPDIVVKETQVEINKIDTVRTFFDTKATIHPSIKKSKQSPESKLWSWEKAHMFSIFKVFVQAHGATESKWDAARFNACCERFFLQRHWPITTSQYGDSYFWTGVRYRADAVDEKEVMCFNTSVFICY
jgi:hypothetical protein